MTISHLTLDRLQRLPDGSEFFACFTSYAPSHLYVMSPELRDFVTHRAHLVFGSFEGDRSCGPACGDFSQDRGHRDEVCPSCHHLNRNHPECGQFSWMTVLCGNVHLRLEGSH